ncbi:hypothetical protein PhCBS80983_g02058 [Powellomyces hirtus]|uniref:Uncharacterized protein n=1 Tax=Powellomyces hirtus TaxID=109895 RepID=A0A507E7F9_9FUNG|nr:hypothetical protein PhCBS80983_g02058 [Powellomyces hirtus]
MSTVNVKTEILGLYRGILREVSRQYTARNQNRMWHDEIVAGFKSGVQLSNPAQIQIRLTRARNLHAFLRSNRTHRELVERYWPISSMTEEEKLSRTANTVGLSLPKMFGAGETFAPSDRSLAGAETDAEPVLSPQVEEALNIIKNAPS